MKRTNKKTNTILVKAYTNSEWDNCDFAIIHIDEKWIEKMNKRIKAIENLVEDEDFNFAYYYDNSFDFYKTKNIEITLGSEDYSFVELEEDEESRFSIPENRLTLYRIAIYKNGYFRCLAWGKHNIEEEFFTEEINFYDLIK